MFNEPMIRKEEKSDGEQSFQELYKHMNDMMFMSPLEMFKTSEMSLPSLVTDICDDEGEMIVTAEMPGLCADDVDLNVKNNVLTISAKKMEKNEEKNKDHRLYERRFGSVKRSFKLNNNVDLSTIEASLKNGILTIKMKKTDKEEEGVKIPISS